MRGAAVWTAGSILAFLLTAGAFLLLANLATGTAEESLTPDPDGRPGRPGAALDLDINRGQLSALQPEPAQTLQLAVENAGDRDFSEVTLTLEVSSNDTSQPQTTFYRRTIADLPAGETAAVRFALDLSAVTPAAQTSSSSPPETRGILEIRATTPEGVSAVRTAIVPM